jgi:voltage-gated potassium channel
MARLRIPPVTVLLGVAGVAPDERPLARRVGKWFEVPMLVLVGWLAVDWYLDVKRIYPPGLAALTNYAVWGFFVLETAVMTTLVERKFRYLATNWLNLVIIVASASVIWGHSPYTAILRSVRLLVILPLLLGVSPTLRKLLARNHFGFTLLVAFFIVSLAGVFMAGLDPGVETVWDGLWWAWVTVSTVGYGDLVPTSGAGRLFGALLILLGVGLFSLVTANISAYFVSQEEEKVKEEEARLRQEQHAAHERLERLERRIRRLEALLGSIDQRLEAQRRAHRRGERARSRPARSRRGP